MGPVRRTGPEMRQVGEEGDRGASPHWKPEEAEGTGKSSPQLPESDTSRQGQGASGAHRLVQQGGRRPGKVNVSDAEKRSGSQKEDREGVVTVAAVATMCPLDWPPVVTSDRARLGIT